ncbi:MAG: Crp/Fnr family transcriptional regulator [Bacteroidota bacterium]
MQALNTFLEKDLRIPKELVLKITSYYKQEQLSKNEFLVKEGMPCDKLCWIEKGYWRFFSYSDKKVITHWIFGQDQFVTDMASFYLREPAKWNIQALTDTHIFSLSYADFQRMRSAIPVWDAYEKNLFVRLLSGMENRVYALLSMSAEERYQYLYSSDSKMFQELPLHYLASMLGMSPETLSRIRRKFTT